MEYRQTTEHTRSSIPGITNATALLISAYSCFLDSRLGDTIDTCTEILSDQHRSPEAEHSAFLLRGWAHYLSGAPEIASFDFTIWINTELKRDGSNPSLGYSFRAACYTELNRIEQAIADYQSVLTLDPGNATAQRLVDALENERKGRNSSKMGDAKAAELGYLQAIESYSAVYDQYPADSRLATHAIDRRGQLRLEIGSEASLTDAIEDFSTVIAQNNADAQAYLHRGMAYFGLGLYTDAVLDCHRVLENDNENALAHQLNGTIALLDVALSEDRGAVSRARAAFKAAFDYSLDPQGTGGIDIMLMQAVTEYITENYEKALTFLRKVEPLVATLQNLQNYEWVALQQKLTLLRELLPPEVVPVEVDERVASNQEHERGQETEKKECDTLWKPILAAIFPETPAPMLTFVPV